MLIISNGDKTATKTFVKRRTYTISNNLKRMGIDVSDHAEERKYKTEGVIRLYTKERKSVKQIAQMFGVCDGTIY